MREGSEDKTVDERVNEITREAVDEIDGLEELMNSGPVFGGKADEHKYRPREIVLELVEFAGKREHKRGYFAGPDKGREQSRENTLRARHVEVDEYRERTRELVHGLIEPVRGLSELLFEAPDVMPDSGPPRPPGAILLDVIEAIDGALYAPNAGQGARPSVDVPEVEERTDGEAERHGPAPTSGSSMPVGGTGVQDSKADKLLECLRLVDELLAGVEIHAIAGRRDEEQIQQNFKRAKRAIRNAIKWAESDK